VLKKDRQQNCYMLAYPKNNDTNILPHSFRKKTGVAELRYDLCGQGMFWLPDLPRLSAIEMIRWIGNRNIPKLKIMNY
jgi:hypothetical protein